MIYLTFSINVIFVVIVTEPSNYVCSTCKQRFQSAWTLVQHVQAGHGIKIYVEMASPAASASSTTSTSSTSSLSSSALPSLPPPVGPRLHDHPPRSSASAAHHAALQPPLPSALDPHNPFGLLRMPLTGDRQFSSSSVAAAAAAAAALNAAHHNPFARPTSHDFRMEQLVSEQFRLNPHGLGLATSFDQSRPPPPFPDPFERPPTAGSTSRSSSSNVPPPQPPSLALNLEPQLDFYSQRLRQLAGTTSPGGSSPSPRKQILTPPFTSPTNNNNNSSSNNNLPAGSSRQQETTPPAAVTSAASSLQNQPTSGSSSSLSHSLNSSSSGNGSVGRQSLTPPQKRPPSQPLNSSLPTCEQRESDLTHLPSTPRRRAESTPPDPTKVGGEEGAVEVALTTSFHHVNRLGDTTSPGRTRACEFCGKKFRFESNLIVHRRSHTGEKPYRCSVCNHACSQSSKLKRHMKIHRAARNGATTNGSTHSTPESAGDNDSLGGSIETLDSDEDEGEEEEEEEDELEEMELEEEEGEDDDDLEGDAPEDLTTKSTSSATSTPTHPAPPPPPPPSSENNKNNSGGKTTTSSLPITGSLVGELMDKFGLSNIQQYNEAYKQALQESGTIKHLSKMEKPPANNNERIRDNNNISTSSNNKLTENGIDKSSALRFRDEFTKGLIGQPSLDMSSHSIFGAFENPFDASKRLKLDLENHPLTRSDRDSLYAGLWLPTMTHGPHRDLFGIDHSSLDILGRSKSSDHHHKSSRHSDSLLGPKAGPSASAMTAAAVAAGLNLGLAPSAAAAAAAAAAATHHMKKESRRNDTCEYCGKVFKNCSNLTVHRRSHTGEKPYKCELCSYACAQSSKLTRHMKTHGRLGKDVYRCRFCEMPFSVPSTLEKHMRKCVVNQNNKAAGLLPSLVSGDDTGDSSASASKDTT